MKINSEEFEKIIEEFEIASSNIEEIFKRIDNTMSGLHNNDVWQGLANESYYNRCKTLNLLFPKVNNTLDNYIKFLNTTLDNYVRQENIINQSADNNSTNLDVN